MSNKLNIILAIVIVTLCLSLILLTIRYRNINISEHGNSDNPINRLIDSNTYGDIDPGEDVEYISPEKMYFYQIESIVNFNNELTSIQIIEGFNDLKGELKFDKPVLLINRDFKELQVKDYEKIYFIIDKLPYNCEDTVDECMQIMTRIDEDFRNYGGIWEYDIENKTSKRIYQPENENIDVDNLRLIIIISSSKQLVEVQVVDKITRSEFNTLYYHIEEQALKDSM